MANNKILIQTSAKQVTMEDGTSVEQKIYNHTHTKSQITDMPTALKNPNALTINGTNYDGSSAVSMSLAVSSHTHPYAGSSTAGGAANSANKVNKSLSISLNGGDEENSNLFTFDGSTGKSIDITPESINAATEEHTHVVSNITDFPTSLKNPNALTISLNGTSQGAYDGSAAKSINITPASIGAAVSAHTHNYAGSSSAGGAANSANKVNKSLIVSLNGGDTEGTNLFTFDGSTVKSIDITPESINASVEGHTHTKSEITDFPTSLKNPNALTINGVTYDGSEAKTFTLATSTHTHNYAGSSSAGGAATSAAKVTNSLIVKLNSGTTEGTNMFTFNGSAAKTVNITPAGIGAALSSHTHNYAGSSSAGGAANSANKVNKSLIVSLNGGDTEGTNLFTFDGSTAKNIDITPESINASVEGHTHTKSEITDFPTSLKNPNALTINGTTYDGSAAKTFSLATASHTHNYAGSSSAGGAANSIANSLTINGTSYNGSKAISLDLAEAEHTHVISELTDMPTSLKNPNALTINGTTYDGSAAKTFSLATSDHTHNYAGSSSAGGAATSANKVNSSLIVKLNGGTTEGSNMFTFNGSAAKTVNITPALIGASVSSHTHPYAGSSSAGGAANSVANSLTINGTSYNGSAAKTVNITTDSIGAAEAEHSHTEADIEGTISASKISGVLSLDNIPKGALERVVTVENDTARYALTSSSIQLGDTVKVTDTGLMYIVINESKLSSADGYMEYTAGSASSVPWSGVTGKPTTMKNPYALTINGTAYDGSAAKTFSLALATHTHNYAGSSSAGGVATSAAKVTNALTISLNGTSQGAYDGSAAKSINITPASIGASATSHTHKYAGSSSAGGAANSVANALTINSTKFDGSEAVSLSLATASHTHSYAGSSSAGGAATSANKVNNSLIVKLNSGTTEGTNMFTFNGSAAKTVNITPAGIGAALSSHTHNYAGSSSAGGAANSVKASLAISLNGGEEEDTDLFTFNGSTAKSIDITPESIGASATSHTHNYAGSSSAGGAATSAAKVTNALTINGTTYDGSAAKTFNLATSSHTHNYAGSSSAGGAATSANKVNTNLIIKLNSGATEGTDLFTFNGSTAKTVNITPASIGAALSSHTHSYAGSSSAGGAATSALKVANALTINGTTYDGSAAKSFDLALASHTHSYAGSSSAGGSANSAVKLATARTIDGVSFNGSAAITHYGTCSTASATVAKVVSLTGFTLVTGAKVAVKFTAGSDVAAATLNVNSTGAKAIYYKGAAITASNKLIANNIYEFIYDGTNYLLVGDLDTNTTYTSLKNPNALTISLNGTSQGAYDGSAAKSINITPASIGASATSHTHKYAGSSSAGGAATSANKVNSSLIVKLNSGATEGTNLFTFNGSAAKTVNITPASIGLSIVSEADLLASLKTIWS